MKDSYKVTFMWDGEADVWVATSNDIRGLVLEHDSLDALMDEVLLAVPELLNYNNTKTKVDNVSLDFSAHRRELVACSG